MKFDYILGNPPYQEETDIISETNGQLRRKSIFQYFQQATDELAEKSAVLIYPAGRWIQRSGRGMKEFGLQQINDEHLAKVIYYPDASEVFPSTEIADGISIVVKRYNKEKSGFEYVYCKNGKTTVYDMDNPGESIMPLDPRHNAIVQRIDAFVEKYHLPSLRDRISPQKLFGIESDFVDKNPDKVRLLNPDSVIDYDHELKLFTNDRAGKGGRSKWYIADKDCVASSPDLIGKWKVVVSSANAGGQKRDNQIAILDNHSVFGRSRVALGLFDTKEEAENFFAYMNTYIVRFAFLMTDENLATLGIRVPDIITYSTNELVTFDDTLDEQLFDLCELSEEERDYVRDVVDNIRKKD